MPFVVEKTMTSVSSSHGAPVFGSRVPPHRSTTFSPRKYTAQAAPSSSPLRKFSSNACRTGSNPGATDPFTLSIDAPTFTSTPRSLRPGRLADEHTRATPRCEGRTRRGPRLTLLARADLLSGVLHERRHLVDVDRCREQRTRGRLSREKRNGTKLIAWSDSSIAASTPPRPPESYARHIAELVSTTWTWWCTVGLKPPVDQSHMITRREPMRCMRRPLAERMRVSLVSAMRP